MTPNFAPSATQPQAQAQLVDHSRTEQHQEILPDVQSLGPHTTTLAAQCPEGMNSMRKAPKSFTFLQLIASNTTSFAQDLSNYLEPLKTDENHQKKSGKALGKTLDATGKKISEVLTGSTGDPELSAVITSDLVDSFKKIQQTLQTPSTDIDKHTNTVLPFDPQLTQRSHAEIALHFILEAKFKKAADNLAANNLALQIKPAEENEPTIEIQSLQNMNHPLDNHSEHSVSGKDHRCWLHSLWFTIFSKLPKDRLIEGLSKLFPNDVNKISTLVSNLHTDTIDCMIEGISKPYQPFQFSENTEADLLDLSNQILRQKGAKIITGTDMADTGHMQMIAEALDVTFVQSETADGNLLRQGAEIDIDQTSIRQSIANEAVIIGGRGIDMETKLQAGEDHFSLYLPKDTQLFQTQLRSLKDPASSS